MQKAQNFLYFHINNALNPKGKQRTEFNNMRSTITFVQNLVAQGRTVAQLTPAEISSLTAMAGNTNAGRAAASAENILCFFYDLCNPVAPAPKSLAQAYTKPKPPQFENAVKEYTLLKGIPNPADQYLDVEYKTLFASEQTVLHIWDMAGRLVYSAALGKGHHNHHVVDTRTFVPGMYIIELLQDGKSLKKEKVIIQH